MFTSTWPRYNAALTASRLRPFRSLSFATSGKRVAVPQCLPKPPLHRLESTAARQARQSTYKYPESISVYLAPPYQTAFIGALRLGFVVLFMIGTSILAPMYYTDPETPNWMVPVAVVGSAAPFLAAAAYGPTVANIKVFLPTNARRSKEALMAFANNVPPNTRVRLQFIRFAPWLVTRTLFFEDLRRLPQSRIRLSNLEHIPLGNESQPASKGLGGWFVKMYMGRYWVNMVSTSRDRSGVPGAWERMWGQIPLKKEGGEEMRKEAVKKARTGSMADGPIVRAWPRARGRR